jgi:hypothetical protein
MCGGTIGEIVHDAVGTKSGRLSALTSGVSNFFGPDREAMTISSLADPLNRGMNSSNPYERMAGTATAAAFGAWGLGAASEGSAAYGSTAADSSADADLGSNYGYSSSTGFTDTSGAGFNGTGAGQAGAYDASAGAGTGTSSGAASSSAGSDYPTTSGTPSQSQYPGFDLGAGKGGYFSNLYGSGAGTGGAASSGIPWGTIKSATQLAGTAYGLYDSYQQRQQEKKVQEQRKGYMDQINRLTANPNSVTNMPGYQFGLTQGNQALNRQLAAQGLTGSGAQMQELQQFNQQYAGQFLNQEQARLAGLAGMNWAPPASNANRQMNDSLNGLVYWAMQQAGAQK